MRLGLERLEARDVPSTTLASFIDSYDSTYARPMPDVPADQVIVATIDPDPADPLSPIYEVFAAHGSGNAARLAVKNADTGEIVADFFVFEETFRGGVGEITAVGREVFVTPGDGGGARAVAIDIETKAVRSFAVPGISSEWRNGVQGLAAADVDGNGVNEVVFLCGTVAAYSTPAGVQVLEPVFVTDAADARRWEFVPAGVGVQLGSTGSGFAVQLAGEPEVNGERLSTRSLFWSGDLYQVE